MAKLTDEERIKEEAKLDNFFAKSPSNGKYYTYDEIENLLKGNTLIAAREISNELLDNDGKGFVELDYKYKEEKLVLGIYSSNKNSEAQRGKEDPSDVWYNTMLIVSDMFLKNNADRANIYKAYNKIVKRPNKDQSLFLTGEEIKNIVSDPKKNYFEKSINAMELFCSMRFDYEYKEGSFDKAKSKFVKDMSKIYKKSSFNINQDTYNLNKAVRVSTNGNVKILLPNEIKSYSLGGSITEEEYVAGLIINYDCNNKNDFSNIYNEVTSKYGDYNSYKNISEIYKYCTGNPLLIMDYSVEEYKSSDLTTAKRLIDELVKIKFGEGSDDLNRKVAGVLLDKKYPITNPVKDEFNKNFRDTNIDSLLEYVLNNPATGWKEGKKPVNEDSSSTTSETKTPDSSDDTESDEKNSDQTETETKTEEPKASEPEKVNPTEVPEVKVAEEEEKEFKQEDTGNKKKDGTESNFLNVDRYWNFKNNVSPEVEIQFRLTLNGIYGWHSLDDLLNSGKGKQTSNNDYFISFNMVDNGAKRVNLELFDRNFVDIEQILGLAINELQQNMGKNDKVAGTKIKVTGSEDWEGKIETDSITSNMRIRFGYQDKNIMLTNHSYSGFGSAIRNDSSNKEYARWRELGENKDPETTEGFIDEDISDGTNFKHKFQQSTIRSTWSEFFINGLSSNLTDTGVKYSISGISTETMKLSGYKMVQRYSVLKGKPLRLLDSFRKNFSSMVTVSYDDEVKNSINGTDIFYDYEKGEYVKVDETRKNEEIKKEQEPIQKMKEYLMDLKNLKSTILKDPTNTLKDYVGGIDINYNSVKDLEEFDKGDYENRIKIDVTTPLGVLIKTMNVIYGESENWLKNKPLSFVSNAIKNVSELGPSFIDYCTLENLKLREEEVELSYREYATLLIAILGINVYSGFTDVSTWGSNLKTKTSIRGVLEEKFFDLSDLSAANEELPIKWKFARSEEQETIANFPVDNICDNGIKGVVSNSDQSILSTYENKYNLYYPGVELSTYDSTYYVRYNKCLGCLNKNKDYNATEYFPSDPGENSIKLFDWNKKEDREKIGYLFSLGFAGKNSILNELSIKLVKFKNLSRMIRDSNKQLTESAGNFINILSRAINGTWDEPEPLGTWGEMNERRDIFRIAQSEVSNESSDRGLTIRKALEICPSSDIYLLHGELSKMITDEGDLLLNGTHQWIGADGAYIYPNEHANTDAAWKTAKETPVRTLVNTLNKGYTLVRFEKMVFDNGLIGIYLLIGNKSSGPSKFSILVNTTKDQYEEIKGVFKGREAEVALIWLNAMLLSAFCSRKEEYGSNVLWTFTREGNLLTAKKIFERKSDQFYKDEAFKIDKNYKAILSNMKKELIDCVFSIINEVNKAKEKLKEEDTNVIDELNMSGDDPLTFLIKKEIHLIDEKSIKLKDYQVDGKSKEKFSRYPVPVSEYDNIIEALNVVLKGFDGGTKEHANLAEKNSNKLGNYIYMIDEKMNSVQKEIDERLKKIEGWNNLNIGKEIEISLGNQYSRDNANDPSKKRWKSLSSIFNEFCSKCPALIDKSELIASGINDGEEGGKETGTVRMYDENGEETNVKTLEDFPRYNLAWTVVGGDKKDSSTKVKFYYKKPEVPQRIRVYDWGVGNPNMHCVKGVNISSGNEYAMMHASAFVKVDDNSAPFLQQKYNNGNETTGTSEIQTSFKEPMLAAGMDVGSSAASAINNMRNTICKGNITLIGDPSIKFQGNFQPFTYPVYLNIILPNRSKGFGDFNNALSNKGNTFQYQMSGYYIVTKITHNISSSGFTTTLEVMRYPGSNNGA